MFLLQAKFPCYISGAVVPLNLCGVSRGKRISGFCRDKRDNIKEHVSPSGTVLGELQLTAISCIINEGLAN